MIRFHLNGTEVEAPRASPSTTLLQWIRARGDTGTKEGCAEGDCGACTVAILDHGRWRAINSCLILLPMVHGRQVVTVEGLAAQGSPHPVQQAMIDTLGSQCGYCTPGFVMSLFEASHRTDLRSPWQLDDQICGNLCRCTGYRPIRDALAAVAGQRPADRWRDCTAPPVEAVHYESDGQRFDAPTTLEGALSALQQPDARLVCGATDLGLEVTQGRVRHRHLVSLARIASLSGITAIPGATEAYRIGATTPLVDVEDWSADNLPILHRMLRYFGSRQIKHRGTVGGNLCNASPIGDLAPVFLALDAEVVATGPAGERAIPIDAFFTGYRQTALAPTEILTAVQVRIPGPDVYQGAYKVSRRRELDISAVAAAMRVEVDDGGSVVGCRIAYGGMAATPARATATEAALIGGPLTVEAATAAAAHLDDDFTPLSDPRGSAWYRRTVAANLLIGFATETLEGRQGRFVPLADRHAGTVMP